MATRIGKWGYAARDARGHTGRAGGWITWIDTSLTTRGAANELAFSAASQLAALGNAQPTAYTGLAGEYLPPDVYGSTSQFQNAEDKARLIFLTALGLKVTYEVAAPKAAMFLADLETVDPAYADLATFISTVTVVDGSGNFISTRGGQAITNFLTGYRVRRPFQRKTTIWTLDPSELEHEE